MEEVWKDIKGYEGIYQVSSLGRVKRLAHTCVNTKQVKRHLPERMLLPTKQSNGYVHVHLHQQNKTQGISVHRLVATAFIPNPNNLPQVNHKDEDKTNNNVENLEWCTAEYNINYGTGKKRLSEFKKNKKGGDRDVKGVCKFDFDGNLLAEYPSVGEASRQTGINQATISSCCLQITKQTHGCVFEFADNRENWRKPYNQRGISPYKLRHIKTGLFYQVAATGGNNLSIKGQIYRTLRNVTTTRHGRYGVVVIAKAASKVYKETKDIIAWEPCQYRDTYYVANIPANEFEKVLI